MSYTARFNNTTVVVSSFEKARAFIREQFQSFLNAKTSPLPATLFRSPQTAARINAQRERTARKMASALSLPKTACNVSGTVASAPYAIVKEN